MASGTIRKVLIANRGEIANRVIRTLKTLGIATVAVYETPDANSGHLRLADETAHLGDGPNSDYLNVAKIIAVAHRHRADAIHPGCGFLAENAELAAACVEEGVTFIGPRPETLRLFGDKLRAKEVAAAAGAAILPNTEPVLPDERGFSCGGAFIAAHGYPVIVKSLCGGGGRGIRRVENGDNWRESMRSASAETRAVFGDGRIYLEKGVVGPRHVEVQILADHWGNTLHLGTRDCSIQRRHQKLIEVAPAALPPNITNKIQQLAIAIARSAHYLGAGTVEFLFDAATRELWFMEVNGRLQVEHTVTEMLTGVDIVAAQVAIAGAEVLTLKQEEINLDGVAIEVRINAEDPQNNFHPDGGKVVESCEFPGAPFLRIDSAIRGGDHVPSCYDSLLVKLIVKGEGREQAVRRLRQGLNEIVLIGPKTTIPLYLAICDEKDFQNGNYGTDYLTTHPEVFRYSTTEEPPTNAITHRAEPSRAGETSSSGENTSHGERVVRSPIKGRVVRILMEEGSRVEPGDPLVELEAMKMRTYISAPQHGVITKIFSGEGDSVDAGSPVVALE